MVSRDDNNTEKQHSQAKPSQGKSSQLTLRYGHCFALSPVGHALWLRLSFSLSLFFNNLPPFSFPLPIPLPAVSIAMPFPLVARPGYNFNRLPVGTFHFNSHCSHIYCATLPSHRVSSCPDLNISIWISFSVSLLVASFSQLNNNVYDCKQT